MNAFGNLSILLLTCIVGGYSLSFAEDQTPQELNASINSQLVALEATGTNNAEKQNSSKTTGFAISDDGFVLTAYELVSKLGDVRPKSIDIRATGTQGTLPAVIYSSDPLHNLLLLQVKGLKGVKDLVMGISVDFDGKTPLTISTFGGVGKFLNPTGWLKTPDGYWHLWETSFTISDETSIGSPVYGIDGKILGIVRGKMGPLQAVHVIPIDLADSLLAPLKLSAMKQNIEKLRSEEQKLLSSDLNDIQNKISVLQHQFTWTLRKDESDPGSQKYKLCYQKLIPGNLKPDTIDIFITLTFTDKEGNHNIPTRTVRDLHPTVNSPAVVAGADAECEGSFDITSQLNSVVEIGLRC